MLSQGSLSDKTLRRRLVIYCKAEWRLEYYLHLFHFSHFESVINCVRDSSWRSLSVVFWPPSLDCRSHCIYPEEGYCTLYLVS